METVELRDEEGNGITLKVDNGVPVLPGIDIKSQLQEFDNMEYYDDDVCLVSYPKSGTYWTTEILNMLVKKTTEYLQESLLLMEFHKKELHDNILRRPRVFVTHILPKQMLKSMIEKRVKIVFVYRNPKDVSVSLYNFSKKLKMLNFKDIKWNSFFRMFLEGRVIGGSWLDYMLAWQTFCDDNPDYPVMKVSYEGMQRDLRSNVKALAEFLKTDTSSDDMDTIATKCQFSLMSAAKNKSIPERVQMLSEEKTHIFFRKGVVNDWKNWFTVAQDEEFEATIGKDLPKLKLTF